MNDSDLPDGLLQLIRYALPSFPAAELLVFLAGPAKSCWTVDALIEAFPQRAFNAASVTEYLSLFQSRGLIEEEFAGCFVYRPDSPELANAVDSLVLAFNERPVTLIRNIYAMADHPIRSFADAFRIKKDAR